MPSIEYLPKIADFYNCSVNAFFSDYEMQLYEQFAPLSQQETTLFFKSAMKSLDKDPNKTTEEKTTAEKEQTLPLESLFLPALYDAL